MIDTPARVFSPPNHRGTVVPSRASPSGEPGPPSATRTADQDSVVDTSASPSATMAPPSRVQAAILLSLVPWATEASSWGLLDPVMTEAHWPTPTWSASTPVRMTSTALCLAVHAFVFTHHSTPRVSVAAVTFRVATYPERLVAGIVFCQVPVQPEGIGEGFSSA